MKKIVSTVMMIVLMSTLIVLTPMAAFATESETVQTIGVAAVSEAAEAGENTVLSAKAIAAAIVVGLVGAGAAVGMGMTVAKSTESMARQPEIAGKINSTMMLGLVFIETAIIYALVIAILVIFVL